MKTTINLILFLALALNTANAQVGIGTETPDASAILEVDVTSLTDKQGFLPPRLSSAERDAIASPPKGLTIFNTTTNAIEFSDGTNWINLNDNSTVAVNGDPAPTGNGDVGIGTETPDANAALDVVSTDRGFLPPRMTTTDRDAIASPTKGLVIFNETTTCLQWYDGDFWFDGCSGSEGPDPLPGNITLEPVSSYYIASADDDDYLDGSGALPNNTTEAQLPGGTEDEADPTTTETAINIQGTLTTAGVTINIPYEVVTNTTTLPAFEQTITIPAEYTQTGASAVDVKFSYPEQTDLAVGTGVVEATLQAVGNDLDVIKFDLNSGFGADYLGFLLGKFVYALDSAGTLADLEVRGIPGIPDKNIGDGVHDFIYLPITSTPTGKTWLNNDLGAHYANINNAAFDPAQQATASNDFNAYGSLFQWGRVADGHEIINWTSSTGSDGAEQSNETTTTSSTPEPATSEFIIGSSNWYSGSSPAANDLWQENTKTTYDPCPNGFRVPTEAEWQAEIDNGSNPSWSNRDDAFDSDLALPGAGYRSRSTGALTSASLSGFYWFSTVSGNDSRRLFFNDSNLNKNGFNRAFGMSVRCIKE